MVAATTGCFIWLLGLFFTSFSAVSSYPVNSFRNNEHPYETVVTVGVTINEIDNSEIYTDTAYLLFTLPTLPRPNYIPRTFNCKTKDLACISIKDIHTVNEETMSLLEVGSKQFTRDGLDSAKVVASSFQAGLTQEEKRSDDVKNAGVEWYKEAKLRVGNATLIKTLDIQDDTEPERPTRYVPSVLPFLWNAGKHALPFLFDSLKSLFVPNHSILPSITNIRAYTTPLLKPFLDIPKTISEIWRNFNRNKLVTEAAEENFTYNQAVNLKPLEFDLAIQNTDALKIRDTSFARDMLMEQAEITRQKVYFDIQNEIIHDCRENMIPMGIIPPKVLQQRITSLEKDMDSDMEVVFNSKRISYYYTLKTATCKFETDGGVIGIKTFIRPSNSTFLLRQVKTFAFAWRQKTCDFGIPITLIVQDIHTGSIFPVTDVDEKDCEIESTTVCKLPQEANADIPGHQCLSAMLSGGSNKEITQACPLQCRDGNKISFTQVDLDTVVFAHLPFVGAQVICEDGERTDIIHNYNLGAIRIRFKCGCKLWLNGKVIAKSSRLVCDKSIKEVTIEHIIPTIMSLHHNKYVPFINGKLQENKYSNQEVIDEAYTPEPLYDGRPGGNGWLTLSLWTIVGWICQISFSLIFIYHYKYGPFAVLQYAQANLPLARAERSDQVKCHLPNDIFWLLLTMCGLVALQISLKVITLILKRCKKYKTAYLNREVIKATRAAQGQLDTE